MKKETVLQTFTHMPQLTTERLLLRKMLILDAADMYEYASLPQVTRYLLWDPHPDPDYTKRYLAYLQTRYRTGEFYDFAVICRKENKMIGTCGFVRFDAAHDSAEVGYVLNPRYHNQGYATEALRAVLDFGFSQLGLHRIEARFMKDNTASRHVMEKCGMQFEGIHHHLLFIKGRYEDIGICAAINPHHF
ncbi:MAG: GNAT family N-acetyltransferase [Clostridia bacterium]|nr:GNAT family N-acetyltransferase [Clostridia bacterium]